MACGHDIGHDTTIQSTVFLTAFIFPRLQYHDKSRFAERAHWATTTRAASSSVQLSTLLATDAAVAEEHDLCASLERARQDWWSRLA